MTRGLHPELGSTTPDRFPELDAISTAASLDGYIRGVLRALGEDPDREGLRETPERVSRTFRFLTSGAAMDPHALLRSDLQTAANEEMVVARNVEFHALCERYLMPFFGRTHVAFFPSDKTVGTNTIVRLVNLLARRLQTQERLTRQIQDVLEDVLAPRGIAVIVEARHASLFMQGAEKDHVEQITYASGGAFREPEHQGAFTRLLHRRVGNRL